MMTGSDIGLRQDDSKLVPDQGDDVGGQADVLFLQLVAGLDEANFTLGLVGYAGNNQITLQAALFGLICLVLLASDSPLQAVHLLLGAAEVGGERLHR